MSYALLYNLLFDHHEGKQMSTVIESYCEEHGSYEDSPAPGSEPAQGR